MYRQFVMAGIAATALSFGAPATAATLDVMLADAEGVPADTIAVMATPTDPAAPPAPTPGPGLSVMDQVDERFVPQLLVVQTGTPVAFPNSDQVRHHVYSFSAAKRFELSLYRGNEHDPITFDREGVIVLGCNIHDHMVGYILVTATPWFAVSDTAGLARFADLPSGTYDFRIWHPGLTVPAVVATEVTVGETDAAVSVAVEEGWQTSRSAALSWNDY
jgi:plastocyanin